MDEYFSNDTKKTSVAAEYSCMNIKYAGTCVNPNVTTDKKMYKLS